MSCTTSNLQEGIVNELHKKQPAGRYCLRGIYLLYSDLIKYITVVLPYPDGF